MDDPATKRSLSRPRRGGRLGLVPLLLAASLALSGCYSKKERAQQHYQAAISLLAKGDTARATVELRNVFTLDPTNHDARATYARLLLKEGHRQEAETQFKRLLEDHPNDLEANRTLAELALSASRFDAASRYAKAAQALSPRDPGTRGVLLSLRYHRALDSVDPAAQARTARDARTLLATSPGVMTARRIVIDSEVRAKDFSAALATVDAGLKATPDNRLLADFRLGLLAKLGNTAGVEAQFKAMIARFPKDTQLPRTLVTWYVEHHKLDAAEAFLRSRIDPASQDPAARLALIRFLDGHRSRAAAEVALKKMLAAPEPKDKTALIAVQAGFDFETGQAARAIAALRPLAGQKKPTPAQAAAAVLLARMQDLTGQRKAAEATLDAVLRADPNQLDAIRMKAGWLIAGDRIGDALVLLRSGLSVAPNNPALLDLMARAYARDGNPNLEGEALRQAVDSTDHAPAQVLRYVTFLMQRQDATTALQTLTTAQTLHPGVTSLLAARGMVDVSRKDWTAAAEDVAQLRALKDAGATAAAETLQARILAGQDNTAALRGFLQQIAKSGGPSGIEADLALIGQSVQANHLTQALAQAETLRVKAPTDPRVLMIHAAILAAMNRAPEAMTELEDALTKTPQLPALWTELYRITAKAKGNAAAAHVLTRALAALPGNRTLLWTKAALLEHTGDIPGAIAIYDGLYKRFSDDPIIANNLASLLATSRTDATSLDRAAKIARRFRDSTVPAFEDTWGWIAFRQGRVRDALDKLAAAAKAMPQDAGVQYHLGRAQEALGQTAQARKQFLAARALLAALPPGSQPAWRADLDQRLTQPTTLAGK